MCHLYKFEHSVKKKYPSHIVRGDQDSCANLLPIYGDLYQTNLNSAIPPIESEGIIYTDDFEKANLFNNYFQGQTILDDSNAVLPELPEPSYLTSLSSIAFDSQEVEEILKTLKTDKASGPDGLSNRILKELSHELSSPLCSLFNKSLSLGKFPLPYKDANVTPVHKKGDLYLVSNYRPISLLNSVAKLFEKFVFNTSIITSKTITCYLLCSQT